MTTEIKVGDIVLARYNKRCKWKEARVWEIDHSRSLPYGIETMCTSNAHGQKGLYFHDFRVKKENLQPTQ